MVQITYVISIYRNKEIEICLPYLLNQAGNLSREFIVVDDNCLDNGVDVAVKLISDANIPYKVIKNPNKNENLGPSRAFNLGCNNSSGKYIVTIDTDDLVPSLASKVCFDLLEKHNADFIYGKTYKVSSEQIRNNFPVDKVSNLDNLSYKIVENDITDFVMTKTRVAATFVMFSKELFIRAGGFDDRLFLQDVAFFLRMSFKSKKLIYVDNFLFYFRKDTDGLSSSSNYKLKKIINADGFYSYYNFYKDNEKELKNSTKKILKQDMISNLFKYFKRDKTIKRGLYFYITFFVYILRKLGLVSPIKVIDFLGTRVINYK